MPESKQLLNIFSIDHTSKYLPDVIHLGDANKNTLGLLPRDAYTDFASKNLIIVATDETTGDLAGYLLYNISRRKMIVSIVHLCISPSYRGIGISRLLFNRLKELTQHGYLSVRVRCRKDYVANKLWPKLDFVAVAEINGRGKNTRLTVWKFEYDHPSLFSYAFEQNENLKVKVVIDANIFYQLQAPDILGHEESLPLLDEWLDIDLYITPEMYNEIARNPNSLKQDEARMFAETFYKVDAKNVQTEFQRIKEELRLLFPQKMKESDESDWRQLAYAIAANIPFFVTRDGPMLKRSDDVFERFGIQILQPSDLVLKQDELMRGDDYAPSRLAGSQIHTEKVHSQQSEKLVGKFLSTQSETRNQFNRKLQLALSKAPTIETSVVMDANKEEYGLISYSREFDNQIIVPIFRVGKTPICDIAAKYLVNNIILTASIESRNTIKISDEYLSDKIISALQASGFFKLKNCWLKISLQGIVNIDDLIAKLANSIWPDYAQETVDDLISILKNTPNETILLETEKALWPLKIKNVNIPVFIAPIRPLWAMHLFDEDTANQDLFGGESSLILNNENVYYGSVRKMLSAPGRLLWYVSAGNTPYQKTKCIKAISYIDDVEIGKPKILFSKYKKLGIYKWENVYNDVAKGDLEKEIMAFKFSKTEIFKNPIPFSQLQEIWKSDGKNFNIVSSIAISAERFFNLYEIGIKGH